MADALLCALGSQTPANYHSYIIEIFDKIIPSSLLTAFSVGITVPIESRHMHNFQFGWNILWHIVHVTAMLSCVCTCAGVGAKPGLWTPDWTHGLDFGLIRSSMMTISNNKLHN